MAADPGPDSALLLINPVQRPEISRGEGTNVLYVDGHVEWVSMQWFHRDLERTQEHIKKKGGE